MRPEPRLKAYLLGLILLLIASPLAPCASALTQDEFETVMIGETKIIMRQTDEYGNQASIFAIMLAGHGQQRPDEAHCAHVAEHTVFRNPEKDEDALGDWVVKANSSSTPDWLLYNGWTGVDHTQFEITVPGEQIPEALERLLWGLFPEKIDKTAYDKEINSRLKSELQYMTTNELATPFHAFNEHFYQGTPYCQNLFSVPVTQVKPEKVSEFMAREYSSSRLVIVLAGNFDQEAALAALQNSVSRVPIEPRPAPPKVNLSLPPVAAVELTAVKHPLLMLGIGSDRVKPEDVGLISTAMRIALGRLASQPPDGFTASPSLLSLLRNSQSQGLLVSYEPKERLAAEQLEDQAESLSPAAKEVLHDLAVAGPTREEVAPFLQEYDMEAGFQENTPRTLIAAFLRGRQEIPGIDDLSLQGITEEKLAAALQNAVARYEGSLQYTVLAVMPGKTPILAIAVGIGLAIVIIAAFVVLRRRMAARAGTP